MPSMESEVQGHDGDSNSKSNQDRKFEMYEISREELSVALRAQTK